MTTFSPRLLLILLGVALAGAPAVSAQAESTVHKGLNQKIVKFAAARLGKRVGDGGCYALAEEALKEAGAAPPSRLVWGSKLRAADPIYPGDVVQFTGVRIERPDGSFFVMEQHTAIVYRVHGGRKVTLIHQNFGNKPSETKVTTTVIDLKDVKKGTVDIYHPQPRAKE
jgi:hypothetical protein